MASSEEHSLWSFKIGISTEISQSLCIAFATFDKHKHVA